MCSTHEKVLRDGVYRKLRDDVLALRPCHSMDPCKLTRRQTLSNFRVIWRNADTISGMAISIQAQQWPNGLACLEWSFLCGYTFLKFTISYSTRKERTSPRKNFASVLPFAPYDLLSARFKHRKRLTQPPVEVYLIISSRRKTRGRKSIVLDYTYPEHYQSL